MCATHTGEASDSFQTGIAVSGAALLLMIDTILAKMQQDGMWDLGVTADVTDIDAGKNARVQDTKVAVFGVDPEGLNAGVSGDLMNVWKSEDN